MPTFAKSLFWQRIALAPGIKQMAANSYQEPDSITNALQVAFAVSFLCAKNQSVRTGEVVKSFRGNCRVAFLLLKSIEQTCKNCNLGNWDPDYNPDTRSRPVFCNPLPSVANVASLLRMMDGGVGASADENVPATAKSVSLDKS